MSSHRPVFTDERWPVTDVWHVLVGLVAISTTIIWPPLALGWVLVIAASVVRHRRRRARPPAPGPDASTSHSPRIPLQTADSGGPRSKVVHRTALD